MSRGKLEILVSRWLAAPRALVFRAFTEPALLEQWFCPSPDVALRVDRCDPRVGGEYRFVFSFPDGRVVPVIGQYRTVDPPRKIVFTWTWEEPDPWAGVVTLVTVELVARNGGTDVEVHHAQLTTLDMKQLHEGGWTATLSRLHMLLEDLTERNRRNTDGDDRSNSERT